MSAFHPFPHLPFELRAQIWSLTITPRVVDVRASKVYVRKDHQVLQLASRTPSPAQLHTCREARKALTAYQRVFSALANADGLGRQYVWLDPGMDVVSIGISKLSHFKPVMSLIQRLKFERKHDKSFARYECDELAGFVKVRELYIVCADGLWIWHYAIDGYDWPCAEENVWMLDPDDDRAVKGVRMKELFDEEMDRTNDHRDAKEIVPFVVSEMGELPRPLAELPQAVAEGGWSATRWVWSAR